MQLNSKNNARSWWRSDVVLALVVLALVVLLNKTTSVFSSLENKFYDVASARTGRPHAEQIVVLDIDAKSIANIGRWPWSREVHAKALDMLTQAKPKVIGHTVFFTEPQTDKGLTYLRQLKELTASLPAEDPLAVRLTAFFSRAEKELDVDTQLAHSIQNAQKVVLPATFEVGRALGKTGEVLPDFVRRHVVRSDKTLELHTSISKPQLPIPMFGQGAAGVGHLTQIRGDDGVLRSDPLFIDHDGQWVPSLSLLVAAQSLNLSVSDMRSLGDGRYQLGGLQLHLNPEGMFFPQFYPARSSTEASPFVVDSFFDFYSGKISPEKYAGKVVLIGSSAEGIADTFATPVYPATPAALLLAHQVSSLLNGHSFSVPFWAGGATVGAMLLVMGCLAVVLPRTSAGAAAAIAAALWLAMLLTEYVLLTKTYLWIPLTLPMALLALGYVSLVTKRYLVTEAGKIKSDEQSAESFRQLGLANQGQGRLDEAFDLFRRVPLNDMVMDNLMNLALDFERKRQFHKAQSVYEHMGSYNKQFKDLPNKLQRAKKLSETVILGGGANTSSLILEGDIQKPILGRYQLEKELGKGAMGVVYLGKDPKINRVVAIKTMALSQEFEGDELTEARERFFREAETAGRLQHPNIVTIFDAGEERDLAYIAMEFLRGKDLLEFTKPGQLLPVSLVVSITARVADALAYAHSLNVVHRDIKPANIMYERQADIVKVTDFGIARVTDSSKTKTGMVLGTPSFMSPEQIAGKKVDGRSDLYSLGVMLFQMLTGYLPFRGESMAELMYKIANEPAPDVRTLRPELPMALAQAVALALVKQEDKRYQTGSQMAQDLRQSLGQLPMGTAPHQTTAMLTPSPSPTAPMPPARPMAAASHPTNTHHQATQQLEPFDFTVFDAHNAPVVTEDESDRTQLMKPSPTPASPSSYATTVILNTPVHQPSAAPPASPSQSNSNNHHKKTGDRHGV